MQCSAMGVFCSAFGGAMLLYVFRLTVAYRNDPDFEWDGWPDIAARVGISLTITVFTFLHIWKGIDKVSAECGLAWAPYLKACTEALMMEMLIHIIGGEGRGPRRRSRRDGQDAGWKA